MKKDKRIYNDLHTNTQKMKEQAARTPLKPGLGWLNELGSWIT
jgi:hypothetical protein